MELRQLKIFLAVASRLNITRAAEDVHLSQSSVSEQLQNLEDSLKANLLDRSQRQLRLTEAGQRLLEYAKPLLTLAEEARSSVKATSELASGTLAVGGLETICAKLLPSVLAAYAATYPSVAVNLRAANTRELLQQVSEDTLDVCLLFGERNLAKNLQSEIVHYEELVVLLPRNHPLAAHTEVTLTALMQEPFLVTEIGCVYRDMFEKAFPSLPNRPRIAGEIGSLAALVGLVELGVGCALLPRLILDLHNRGYSALACTDLNAASKVPVSMVWQRRNVQPPRLLFFMDSVRENFAGVKPGDGRRRHEALCL